MPISVRFEENWAPRLAIGGQSGTKLFGVSLAFFIGFVFQGGAAWGLGDWIVARIGKVGTARLVVLIDVGSLLCYGAAELILAANRMHDI